VRVQPRASYRLQLRPGFGFREAEVLVPDLAALGVSHLYLSPVFQARAGSSHGYDVVDFGRARDELGGAEGFERLLQAVRAQGMGVLVDVVPNHMAVAGRENPWWWSVLEDGHSSLVAAFFDIDWEAAAADGGLLIPVLGDHYGRVLEAGGIELVREGARFLVRTGEHRFPVTPRSLPELLVPAAKRSGSAALANVVRGLGALPAPSAPGAASAASAASAANWQTVERRRSEKDALFAQLGRVLAEEAGTAAAVDAELACVRNDPDRLDRILEQQCYRLAFWRIAARNLSYRRFFDIDQLVALRMEDPRAFAAVHRLVLHWVETGRVDGLRIDHVDGLRDPEAYLRRLREAAPDAWIVVEKILHAGESLPEAWPVEGTTGYDFLERVGGLFVDPAGEKPLTDLYGSFTGEASDYAEVLVEKKRLVLSDLFGSDLRRLTSLFAAVCRRHRRHRDYTELELEEVLAELIAHFPVYRSYVRAEAGEISERDARTIRRAADAAAGARSDLPPECFAFLRDVLCLRVRGPEETELAMRFQQLTGPAMAKGAEDTAFYVYTRFVARNEVGGDPSRLSVAPADFHRAAAAAQARWPRSLLATSTHDTKRSEDVRARLALLSEIPDAWAAAVRRWSACGSLTRLREPVDRRSELLFYQTLVGAWPLESERAAAYLEKAAREAKLQTSWRRPDPDADAALRAFAEGALADAEFLADLASFVEPLVGPGRVNSLAQTLLKLTSPGVPDLYQGTELWDLSLVDPDNRRPVDYALRRRLREELHRLGPEEVCARADEGLPKLWLIQRALALRARRPELFGPGAAGSYAPLAALGPRAEHVVALARGEAALAVVPRLVLRLGGAWDDTLLPLPSGAWRNVLTGDSVGGGDVPLERLLERFPVALLQREEAA
jgi:(1->4)-alpha-D-glucan 1-alpha-D-glucosylmutase